MLIYRRRSGRRLIALSLPEFCDSGTGGSDGPFEGTFPLFPIKSHTPTAMAAIGKKLEFCRFLRRLCFFAMVLFVCWKAGNSASAGYGGLFSVDRWPHAYERFYLLQNLCVPLKSFRVLKYYFVAPLVVGYDNGKFVRFAVIDPFL